MTVEIFRPERGRSAHQEVGYRYHHLGSTLRVGQADDEGSPTQSSDKLLGQTKIDYLEDADCGDAAICIGVIWLRHEAIRVIRSR